MIRVMLVDDQELVRSGLRMTLEKHDDIAIVAEATDGRDALDRLAAARPDVVLMDLRMPNVDGVTATRQISALDDPPAVVVLTTFDFDDDLVHALDAGASGYLLKNATGEQLVEAVRRAADGHSVLAAEVTARVIERARRTVSPLPDPRTELLTEREQDVIIALADGLTNLSIADRLHISEATVKAHLSSILAKLGMRDRTQVVVWAFRSGFLR